MRSPRPNARSALIALGGLIALSGATVSAQQRDNGYVSAWLQRQADQLQRCLESELEPWQVESTLSAEGRLADRVRVTRWRTSPRARCLSQHGTSPLACDATHDLQRMVRLDFTSGESHPAWSANDRARLEDLIPARLGRLSGDVRLRAATTRDIDDTSETLQVRIEYRGVSALQRDVEEWVKAPRQVIVTLSLVDPNQGDRVVASRIVTARQALGFRDLYASTSSARWMTTLLERVDSAAKTILAPLACSTPWLEVYAERGKIWLTSELYAGLREGHNVLLVPTVDTALASRWPIARIRLVDDTRRAELEVIRGSSELCEAGCRAIPL